MININVSFPRSFFILYHYCWSDSDEDLSCNDFFQSGDAEVDAEEAIFVELTQTLLKDPAEREHFYQANALRCSQSMYFLSSSF